MPSLRDALAAALEKEMIRRTGKCSGCVGLANAILSDPAFREGLEEEIAGGMPTLWYRMDSGEDLARAIVARMLGEGS